MAKDGKTSSARTAVWGPMSTRVRQSKMLRQPAISGYRALARVALRGEPPKVFANSIPKAGTHLLTQLLSGVDHLWFSGVHTIDKEYRPDVHHPRDGLGELDPAAFRKQMRKIRDGQFITAHVGALPGVIEVLDELGFGRILMIRDPRDIVVSLGFYHAKNQRLHTYERFGVEMSGPDEQLMAAITGLPPKDGNPPIPSIGERLHKYQAWLTDPKTCIVRFEELVGSGGGGSDEAQLDAVRRILVTCNRDSSDEVVERLAKSVFAPHAATFRRGAIGDWSNHLKPEHLAALDEIAPGEIAAFGYV